MKSRSAVLTQRPAAPLTNESLAIISGLMNGEELTFHGKHFTIEKARNSTKAKPSHTNYCWRSVQRSPAPRRDLC